MDTNDYDIGMIGLGVMGRNLALNMASHDVAVVGYDTDPQKVLELGREGEGLPVHASEDLNEFVSLLRSPRAVMMLVPAGAPVDGVIQEILPLLSAGDILIDGGNSHFRETDRRAKALHVQGVLYLGVGISGGEHGARYGPSIMPGGPREAYERVRNIFEAVAARVDDLPCVAYLGAGSAGHYVKMIHNGIEYGLMQLIAETYDFMKRGLDFQADQLSQTYEQWNSTELGGFLIEITAHIFRMVDAKTGKRLVEVILDQARQKGTGLWTSESAMELQVPLPDIDTAVELRDLSCDRNLRQSLSGLLTGPSKRFQGDKDAILEDSADALYVGMVMTYAQGFALLSKASRAYAYELDLRQIAAIWRGGCIIRSALLEDVMAAYADKPGLPHLLEDKRLADRVGWRQASLRRVVQTAAALGIPAPGMMATLSYYDSLRSPWLPANLIAAQRDYFGAHTYERVDAPGTFHTDWYKDIPHEALQTT